MNLDSFNASQRNAIQEINGPMMVLAGAGSGKTRTLVGRINYLLDSQRLSPYQILALTFSNKAAREMRERVEASTGIDSRNLQITTFHSFCARVLRMEFSHIGLSRNFTIYDDGESKAIVKQLLSQRGISQKEISPFEVMYYMSDLKNCGHYFGRENFEYEIDEKDIFYSLYRDYQKELLKSNALDFGSLIVGVLELFEKFPNVLEQYQNRYEYMMVDEYQDTNRAQFDLICLLAGKKKNLCVVGDEDQSIYSWRGADINNILDFEKVFPEAHLVKLEQNYRSSKRIIEAASHVISKNVQRKGKQMWTDNEEGEPIVVLENQSERDEADTFVKEITKLINADARNDDIAIFYRNNAQARAIEDALRNANMNYQVIGGIRFYERKEIKDIVGYLRLIVNKKDSLAVSRIINVPARGIGATSLKKIEDEAIKFGCSLWEILEKIVHKPDEISYLTLSKRVKNSINEFVSLIEEVELMDKNGEPLSTCYEKILHESGYYEFLASKKDYESQSRIENVEELLNGICIFEENNPDANLMTFLESITLDTSNEEAEESSTGSISLMTVHGSKGLEFPYVFLAGAEENMFPSYRSLEDGDDSLEEERRLFYVAMTRAMKKLWISYASGRMLYGSLKFNGPSRFIFEIPTDYRTWGKRLKNNDDGFFDEESQDWENTDTSFPEESFEKKTYYVNSPAKEANFKFPKGTKIEHKVYGKGSVVFVEGSGNDEKVLIKFGDGSQKKFMVKYAPMVRISN